jgi:hypothetical protein
VEETVEVELKEPRATELEAAGFEATPELGIVAC